MCAVLNDLSRWTRLTTMLQTVGPGVLIGALVGMRTVTGAGLVLLLVAALSQPGWLLWRTISGRRLDGRIWDEVSTGSEEILAGTVRTTSVPARVVRHRVLRRRPHFGLVGGRREGPSLAMAVTVVGPGPARRVGVLAAPVPALQRRDAPLVVAVHPERPEVAVLDDRVGPADVAASARDPRWSGPLPTDGSVVGGWWPVAGYALAGLVAGALLGFALMRLVS